MLEERQVLWIIPGKYENLEDGKGIYYESGIRGGAGHQEICHDFCEKYGIDDTFCTTHTDYGKLFANLGMITVFNSSAPIDGKYFLAMILPEQMTEKQIEFLEARKEFFKEKYYENKSFFDIGVYTEESFSYKTTDGLRDLYIESIIEGRQTDDGQELLYREVERQKMHLLEETHENKI